MRSLPLFLLLLSSCLLARAQNNQAHPYLPELLEVEMEGKRIADTVDVLKNGAAIYPNSRNYALRFSKNADFDFGDGYYLTVLDVQPNGVVNQLYPSPIRADEFIEVSNESPFELEIDSRSLSFTPPYGKEQFLVLFSKRPLVYYNLSSFINDPSVRVLHRNEVDWIMAGAPPKDLENELLVYPLIFEIRPDGSKLKESNVNADLPFEWEDVEEPDHIGDSEEDMDGDGIDDFFSPDSAQVIDRYLVSNADLYSLFPILTFIQPIEPSYESGARGLRVHSVQHSGPVFSITGTLSCSKKMDRIEFLVESMDDRSQNSRSYSQNSFRTTPMALLFSQQINLFEGQNRITVTAYNELGFGVRQELFVDNSSDESIKAGQDHLLVLAVNEYQQWGQLSNAVNDADSLIAVMQRYYGIQEAHTHRLINGSCTKKAIDSVFRHLIRSLQPEDRLMVYFAGHGYYDTLLKEGYWIPVDARKHDWITDSYVPNSTISKYISSMPTRHSLFISDACFSGSYCLSDSRGVQSYLDRMDHARSRWIFSSGRMEEVADDYKGSGHSPFAYYILEYLRNPKQSAFSTSELAAFVTKSVANNSKQTPLARPVRNAGDEGGEYVFVKDH